MLIPLRPTRVEQISATQLAIDWDDGHHSLHTFRLLRFACKCARCKDEMTGKVLNRLEDIPETIHPVAIEPVGGYALRFVWDDGHSSGFYAFNGLREICECDSCQNSEKTTRNA